MLSTMRFSLGLLATLALGCALPDFQKVGAGGAGGAGGGGAGGQGGSAPACLAKKPPGSIPPDASGDPLPPLFFALRSVSFGEKGLSVGPTPADDKVSPGYVPVGYDLDGRCTCVLDIGASGDPGCATPSFIPVGKESYCDFADGVDNQFAWFMAKAATLLPSVSSDAYSSFAEQGFWSLIVRVSGFTGQPNDRVQVRIFNTTGTAECANDPAVLWPPPKPAPSWDGNDCYALDAQSFAAPAPAEMEPVTDTLLDTQGLYADLSAYVSDGILVASLPQAGIELSGGDGALKVQLRGGVITARLVEGPTGWRLEDGVIAGAWALEDLFTSLGEFKVSVAGDPVTICTDTAYYGAIKQELCALTESLSQNLAPSAPCDAISFALGFTADPVKAYPFVTVAPVGAAGCPDATNPKFDSCSM